MRVKPPAALMTAFQEAKSLLQDQKINEARQLLNATEKSEKYFEYHVLMARAAFMEELFDLSLGHLNQALSLDSKSAGLRIKTVSLQLKIDPESKPTQLLDEATNTMKLKPKDIYQAVRLYNRMSNPDRALELLRTTILRMPNDQIARYALARQLVIVKNFDEAITELNNSLALNSGSEKTRILLARILMLEGDLQKSRMTITPLLAMDCKDDLKNKAFMILADISLRTKDFDDSRNYLTKVTSNTAPYYNYLWGQIFENDGNYLNTVNSFNAALAALDKDESRLSADTAQLDEVSLKSRAKELGSELQSKIYQESASEDDDNDEQEMNNAESFLG